MLDLLVLTANHTGLLAGLSTAFALGYVSCGFVYRVMVTLTPLLVLRLFGVRVLATVALVLPVFHALVHIGSLLFVLSRFGFLTFNVITFTVALSCLAGQGP